MRGMNYSLSIEFGEHSFGDAVLSCLSRGSAEHWSIDLPAVMWMLERIAAGDVPPEVVLERLQQATQHESGCCAGCDLASPYFDQALQRYEEIAREWERKQGLLDQSRYRYVLNKGKIHTLDCRYPAKPTLARFPQSLHEFGALFDACSYDLDAVFLELDRQSASKAQRIGMDRVLDDIARYGVTTVKAKLCRVCKPVLPEKGPPAAKLRPACWSWPKRRSEIERLWEEARKVPTSETNVLPAERVAFSVLERWQNGRCAVCGETSEGRLVRDHDHDSGMIRGLLCSGCNTLEGWSSSQLFANYRRRHPAALLAVKVLYLPAGFRPGAGHLPFTSHAIQP